MRMYLLLFTVGVYAIHAEDLAPPVAPTPAVSIQNHPDPGKNVWRISIATLAVANALDVHSSWGKRELNSTLASSNGTFGPKGALLKLGFQGGLIGLEYLVTRGHSSGRLYRKLAFINFGASAAIGGVAAHNYTVPSH